VSEPVPRVRRRESSEIRRAQILEAALRCFGEKGYHVATMDDLARASGLSKGSLYWHFRSKEEVFLAAFDQVADETFAAWDRLLAEGGTTLEVVAEIFESKLVHGMLEGDLRFAWSEFFAHPQARERLARMYRRIRARIEQSLRRDVERGVVRNLPVEGVAAAITAAGEGLMLQAMVDEGFDLLGTWPTNLEVLRRGIAQ
jgi:AcrR family transcriptional regulator